MDISKTTPVTPAATEPQAADLRTALSRVLNMVIGQHQQANVSQVDTLTAEERAQLQQQTQAAIIALVKQLKQLNSKIDLPSNEQLSSDEQTAINQIQKLAIPPQLKNELVRLLQQQQLLKAPQLILAKLETPQKTFWVYTDQPLQKGQQINLGLTNANRLSFTELPPSNSQSSLTTPALNKAVTDAVITQQTLKTLMSNLGSSLPTVSPQQTLPPPKIDIFVNEITPTASKQIPITELSTSSPNKTTNVPLASPLLPEIKAPIQTQTQTQTQTQINGKLAAYLNEALRVQTPNTLPNEGGKVNLTTVHTSLTHIKEALISALPYKDLPNPLLGSLEKLLALPTETKNNLLTPNLEQALKRLAERIRSPIDLMQPKGVAQAFKQSGVLFENQINKNVLNNNQANTWPNDLKENLLRAFSAAMQQTTLATGSPSLPAPIALPLALSKFIAQLRTVESGEESLDADFEQTLLELINKGGKANDATQTKQLMSNLLQQHLAQSIVRLQSHQFQSLSQTAEPNSTEKPATSLQFDIPVRHQHEVHYMQCRLHHDWVDDSERRQSSPQGNTEKVKRWTINLQFDLPTLGEFAAELKVIQQQVSATLWANRHNTFSKANDLLDELRHNLEAEGVEVKQLICVQGLPQKNQPSLGYSLIDVST